MSEPKQEAAKIICPLHGIRTEGLWQRSFADLARRFGWDCLLERWSYGKFSTLYFIVPFTREAKLKWLLNQYRLEMGDKSLDLSPDRLPSVVAHSYGTYILGYTLLRYNYVRFNKILLCGSVLPIDFPWDKLIEAGQVQVVRNEYGARDPWVKLVKWFVKDTGPAGSQGFSRKHNRLIQEKFDFNHGDYFEYGHMEDKWIPFLEEKLDEIPRSQSSILIPRPQTSQPWGTYAAVVAIAIIVAICMVLCRIKMNPTNHSVACNDPFAKAVNLMMEDDRLGGFPKFKQKYCYCPVSWEGIVVATGDRSYQIKAVGKFPEYTNANVTLGKNEVFMEIAPGKPVKFTGKIADVDQYGIFVREASVEPITSG